MGPSESFSRSCASFFHEMPGEGFDPFDTRYFHFTFNLSYQNHHHHYHEHSSLTIFSPFLILTHLRD
ncbi:hypothetical protein P8452_12529 [Trifolium repens]|nr:hypothetical protein P8452_12529 [Trifolium repens]